MLFNERNHVVRISCRQLPIQRSASPLCQGARTLVCFGSKPAAVKNPMSLASNFLSRSEIT